MRKLYLVLFISVWAIFTNQVTIKIEFNQQLADELIKMAKVDQIAAGIRQGKYTEYSVEEWRSFKDSVFTTHQKRLDEIFNEYGYPGYDLVGERGEQSFWLMTQHSDFNPDFQNKVLQQLEIQVKRNNANSRNFGLLTDRVLINTGKQQIYGTQVDYNWDKCQAFSKNLEDPDHVNERRKEVGLQPIDEYLNNMSQMHFEMNKDLFLKKGITGPTLYPIK